ncbi:unnamed protein product [Ixodes pacificus]
MLTLISPQTCTVIHLRVVLNKGTTTLVRKKKKRFLIFCFHFRPLCADLLFGTVREVQRLLGKSHRGFHRDVYAQRKFVCFFLQGLR